MKRMLPLALVAFAVSCGSNASPPPVTGPTAAPLSAVAVADPADEAKREQARQAILRLAQASGDPNPTITLLEKMTYEQSVARDGAASLCSALDPRDSLVWVAEAVGNFTNRLKGPPPPLPPSPGATPAPVPTPQPFKKIQMVFRDQDMSSLSVGLLRSADPPSPRPAPISCWDQRPPTTPPFDPNNPNATPLPPGSTPRPVPTPTTPPPSASPGPATTPA